MQSQKHSHWPLTILGGATSLLNLVLPLVLVRILSTEEVGRYKIFFLYVSLIPWFFLSAGLTNGLSHWAGLKEKDPKKMAEAFRFSALALRILAGFALTLGILMQGYISRALGWGDSETSVFIFAAVFTIAAPFFEEATISTGEIWRGALFTSGFEFVKNISMLTFALCFHSLWGVYWGYTLTLAIKTIAGFFLKSSVRGGRENAPIANVPIAQEVLRYAAPVSISALLSVITNYADQLVLSRMLDSSEFAIYSVGCFIIPPLMIFEQSVNRVLIPQMAAAFSHDQPQIAQKKWNHAVNELGWILIPAVVGLITFAKPIIVLLFTKKFLGAVPYFQISALNYLVFLIPIDAVARARAQGLWILKNLIIFAGLSLALGFVLVKICGAMGALIGVIAVHAFMRGIVLRRLHQQEGWSWSELIPMQAWLKYACFSLILSACSLGIRHHFHGNDFAWFIASGSVFAIVYFGLTGNWSIAKLRRRLVRA